MSEEAKLSILMDNSQAAAELERMANAWERAAQAQKEAMNRGLGSPMGRAWDATNAAGSGMGATVGAAGATEDWKRAVSGLRASAQELKTAVEAAGRMASGQRPAGMFGGMGGMLSGAMSAAGVAAAGQGMSMVASSLDKLNDSTLSASQRTQAFAESLPLVGSFVRGIREMTEAVQGVTDRLRRQALAGEIHGLENPSRLATEFKQGELSTSSAGRRGLADYWQGQARAGFAGLGVADPRNLYDPYQRSAFSRQIGLAQSRQGIQAEIAEVEARQRGQEKERKNAEWEAGVASNDAGEAKENYERLRKEKGGPTFLGINVYSNRNKAEIDQAARDAQHTAQLEIQAREKLKRITEEGQQTAIELEQKKSAAVRASIDIEKEKLTVLKEQEGIVRAQTQSWGRATGAERQVMLAWAKQAQKDPNSLARGQLDKLANYAPNMVARIYEQRGERDPGLREFQDLTKDLNNTPQGLGDNMREQQALEKKIADMSAKSAASAAEASSKAFDSFVKQIIDQFDAILKAKLAELTAGQIRRANGG